MEFNLKTTIKAYPQLSTSLLENYVTKEELAAADYVNNSSLNSRLDNYVTEVPNPDPSIVYGRRKVNGIMTWVPISSGHMDKPFLYGMYDGSELNDITIKNLTYVNLEEGISTYLVEYVPSSSGYFWFCYPGTIIKVMAAGGLSYEVATTQQPTTVTYEVDGTIFEMNCYRTVEPLVAIPGIPWKFEITLGE